MFRSRVFGPPDAFHVLLEYGSAESDASKQKVRLPVSAATLEFDWTSTEAEAIIIQRFVQQQSKLLQDNQQETIKVQLNYGAAKELPTAASKGQQVQVKLQVASSPPVLRVLSFTRTNGSGTASDSLVTALLQHVDLSGVWKLRCCEGVNTPWATCSNPNSWSSLQDLNLSSCGLTALPAVVGQLGSVRMLRLNHNKLTSLPPEIGHLVDLEVLMVNHNQLSTLPAELRRCSVLRELHLEHNKLVTPLLDLTHATALNSLQLYGNPLEYLPDLAPATSLRSISLANVRVLADASYCRWDVEVSAVSTSYGSYTSMVIGSRSHKLQPLFSLMFRRSSIQHPLLAGALGRLIEEPSNLELLIREDVALQQLVLASMASNPLVVEQAVKVIAAVGSYAGAAKRLVKHNVVQAMTDLICSQDESLQLSGLRVLSSLCAGACESEVAGEVLVPTQLLDRLLHIIRHSSSPQQVRCAALHALGNSAFDATNRRRYLQSPGLMKLLVSLAAAPDSSSSKPAVVDDSHTLQQETCSVFEMSRGEPRQQAGSTPSGNADPQPADADACKEEGPAPATDKAEQQPAPPTTAAADAQAALKPAGVQTETSSMFSAQDTSTSPRGMPVGPPTLIMDRNNSIREPAAQMDNSDTDHVPSSAEQRGSSTAAVRSRGASAAVSDATCGTGESTGAMASAVGGASAAAATGFTAVAEAVTAATKSIALAAVSTAAGPVSAWKGSGSGSAVDSSPPSAVATTRAVPAAQVMAAAAGAAAVVAAVPQTPTRAAGSSDDVASPAAVAVGAEVGKKLVPKRRKLVLVNDAVKLQAIRLLAVLGQNEQVRIALGQPAIRGRGLRVLAMDGGGMKGMAMVELLRQLERRAGAPIWTLFDVIGGTSTGGLLAVALGILRLNLDECQDIYTKLGNKVFHQSSVTSQEEASWRESLYRMYATSSANMRVAVYGAKHDAAPYEELLRKFCAVQELGCASDRLIDTAVLGGPKVFVVATLASTKPAAPFAFRNYEVPDDDAGSAAAALAACAGSCKHHVWEAVRASSAAPYYLDDFVTPDGKRFQDGATTANNPAALALQQARLLHPQLPVDCLVSLGCGSAPPADRSKGLSSVIDTGAVLLESACNVDRVHETLAATLPLVPGCKYFRFNTVDTRCAMELDDIKPESWRRLISATSEYCSQTHVAAQFDQLAQMLTEGQASGGARHMSVTKHRQQQGKAAVKHRRRSDGSNQRRVTFSIDDDVDSVEQQPDSEHRSRSLPSTRAAAANLQDSDADRHSGSYSSCQGQLQSFVDLGRSQSADKMHLEQCPAENVGIKQQLASAPRLLYRKGVLLIEAPKRTSATAAAVAPAAVSPDVAETLRQQQQQEVVGELLARSLASSHLLQRCDLSAAAAAAEQRHHQVQPVSTGAGTSNLHLPAMSHRQQQQQQPRSGGSTPTAASTPRRQLQQQQQDKPVTATANNSNQLQGLVHCNDVTPPPAAVNQPASISPRGSSWFDWLTWQSSPSTTEGAAAAAGSKELATASPGLPSDAAVNGGVVVQTTPSSAEVSRRSATKKSRALSEPDLYSRSSVEGIQQHEQYSNSFSSPSPVQSISTVVRSRSSVSNRQCSAATFTHGADGFLNSQSLTSQTSPIAVATAAAAGVPAQVSIDWPGSSNTAASSPMNRPHQQQQRGDGVGSAVAAALRDALITGSGGAGGVGVVHLALQCCSSGLVGGWREEVTAVVEPGAAVSEVVSRLGQDPHSVTLGQLVSASGPLLPLPDCGLLAVLAQQQVLAPISKMVQHHVQGAAVLQHVDSDQLPQPVSAFITSWLLQFIVPDEQLVLGEQEMYSLLSQLQQLVVVSSSWLPPGLVELLLHGGVAAVVAAVDLAAVQQLDAERVGEFFAVFYEGLLRDGFDVCEALQAAAVAVPEVGCGVFECFQLV